MKNGKTAEISKNTPPMTKDNMTLLSNSAMTMQTSAVKKPKVKDLLNDG